MEQKKIIVAGAGGIGEAVTLLLAANYRKEVRLFLGNRTLEKAEKIVNKITRELGDTDVHAFHLPSENLPAESQKVLSEGSLILDCLPGSEAPRLAKYALDYNLHYANLTEYVDETDKIKGLAKYSDKGFILQTGLAPGFVNVLGHHLFLKFCERFRVEKLDDLELKVGALTRHAMPSHFYGFTWSPIGVATEYLRDAVCIRDGEKVTLPSLSETRRVVINGITYEEDLTSGGTADLPDLFLGRVVNLTYKTLRYPGHYTWIKQQLTECKKHLDPISHLQQRMLSEIPQVEEDQVVIYCMAKGKDSRGRLRQLDQSFTIHPIKIGNIELRAIQATTAAALAECARMLLTDEIGGVVLQSMIEPLEFLQGPFIAEIYGQIK